MSTAGIFNTSNMSPTQAARSFANMICTKMPAGQATLFALTSRLQRTTVTHHRHVFAAMDMVFPQAEFTCSLPAAAPGSITTMQVKDARLIIPGHVLSIFNGEQMYVVNVPDDKHVVLQRGVGSTPPAPMPIGTIAYQIGNAHPESSLRPQALATNSYEMDNITQIFRNTWAVSGTMEAETVQYGEHPTSKNKREAAAFHAIDIEKHLWFGERYDGVKNGQPFRLMDGFFAFMRRHAPQNISIAGNQTTYNQLENMLSPAFDVQTDKTMGNDRALFVGSVARKVINQIGRYAGQLQFQGGETSFGMRFDRFKTDRGEFIMVEHPLFNTNPDWARMAVAMDFSSLNIGYMKGRDTQYRAFNANLNGDSNDTDDNGIDAKGGTFTSELTVEFCAPQANAAILGMCEAACEPCRELKESYNATFYVSHPCTAGKVNPGDVVDLFVEGALPGSTVPVITASGIVNITTDGTGAGTVQVAVGSLPEYTFQVVQTVQLANTSFNPANARVCVTQPCEANEPCNDPICPPVVNPDDCPVLPPADCTLGPADPQLIPTRTAT